MKLRPWIIPTLPLVAICCGVVIVMLLGKAAFWLARNWKDITDPGPREASEKINVAFDKIISEREWTTAGLPAGESGFAGFRLPDDSIWFQSQRTFKGDSQVWGRAKLLIEPPNDGEVRRHTMFEGDYGECIKLGNGFETGSTDPGRSWNVFARHDFKDGRYRDLVDLCFHEGTHVAVDVDGIVTEEQAAGFRRMTQGAADRLAVACQTDLRPYVERAAANARGPR